MGVDVELYFECEGEPQLYMPSGFKVIPVRDWKKEEHPGATHEIDTVQRLYSEGYERGHWPLICAALMELFASEQVKKVWYGGDCSDRLPEFTVDDVLTLSRHYMTHGNRPYYKE